MKITERSKRRSPMPGMAISSWPSRKLASRELMARTWSGCRANTSEAPAGRARRNVTVSRHGFRGISSEPPSSGSPACARSSPPSPLCAAAALPGRRRAAAQTTAPGRAGRRSRILGGWRQPDGSRLAAVADQPRAGLAHLLAGARRRRHPAELRLARLEESRLGRLRVAAAGGLRQLDGMRTIGYSGTLVLPVRLVPRRPGCAARPRRWRCSSGSAPTSAFRPRPRPSARSPPDAPDRGPAGDRGGAGRARAQSAAEAGVTARHLHAGAGGGRLRDRGGDQLRRRSRARAGRRARSRPAGPLDRPGRPAAPRAAA